MFCARLFSDSRWAAGLVTLVSVTALGGALISQYWGGLNPCVLCIYQRWPHGIIIVLGLVAGLLAMQNKPKPAAALIFISGLVFAVGMAIGLYHTGVEQHWWASALEACTAGVDTASADLLKQLESMPAARCDVVPWSLFGVSMAGYNALLSGVMAAYAVAASIRITRKANGY